MRDHCSAIIDPLCSRSHAMLSLLPTELLSQIIEATVPHTFRTNTYYERQATLCSLSLVSRRFRAIAQPLLYQVAWISTREGEWAINNRQFPCKVVILGGIISDSVADLVEQRLLEVQCLTLIDMQEQKQFGWFSLTLFSRESYATYLISDQATKDKEVAVNVQASDICTSQMSTGTSRAAAFSLVSNHSLFSMSKTLRSTVSST